MRAPENSSSSMPHTACRKSEACWLLAVKLVDCWIVQHILICAGAVVLFFEKVLSSGICCYTQPVSYEYPYEHLWKVSSLNQERTHKVTSNAGENPSDQISLLRLPCNPKPDGCLLSELLLKVAPSLSVHSALQCRSFILLQECS